MSTLFQYCKKPFLLKKNVKGLIHAFLLKNHGPFLFHYFIIRGNIYLNSSLINIILHFVYLSVGALNKNLLINKGDEVSKTTRGDITITDTL